jgi:hypothetical protein
MYWVVAHYKGIEYKMPIRLERASSNQTRCADLVYEIEDSGTFHLARVTSSGNNAKTH